MPQFGRVSMAEVSLSLCHYVYAQMMSYRRPFIYTKAVKGIHQG